MTTITLNLSAEIERKLRAEAAKQGIEPDIYILNTLQQRLQIQSTPSQPTETELLQQINIGFAAETWELYHTLIAKRQAETLTPTERAQLVQLSDLLEKQNVERIRALIQLATLRQQSLPDLMQALGISLDPDVMEYV